MTASNRATATVKEKQETTASCSGLERYFFYMKKRKTSCYGKLWQPYLTDSNTSNLCSSNVIEILSKKYLHWILQFLQQVGM